MRSELSSASQRGIHVDETGRLTKLVMPVTTAIFDILGGSSGRWRVSEIGECRKCLMQEDNLSTGEGRSYTCGRTGRQGGGRTWEREVLSKEAEAPSSFAENAHLTPWSCMTMRLPVTGGQLRGHENQIRLEMGLMATSLLYLPLSVPSAIRAWRSTDTFF